MKYLIIIILFSSNISIASTNREPAVELTHKEKVKECLLAKSYDLASICFKKYNIDPKTLKSKDQKDPS